MSVWDNYKARIEVSGVTKRDKVLNRERRFLKNKTKNSLSHHEVMINGELREVSVIDTGNLNEKFIISDVGEDFNCGEIMEFADNNWLITEKDANNEIYSKGKVIQCNHLLKWIDDKGIIHQQWCVIEDGTKYLTGEYEDRTFVVTRGDSRIAMTIGRNDDTKHFSRGMRFIIDDEDSQTKLSYLLTKPLKVGKVFNNLGVYSFVLQEVVTTDDDNLELGIADYYKYYGKINDSPEQDEKNQSVGSNNTETKTEQNPGKKVCL